MIQTENINSTHSINSILPNFYIKMPFEVNEVVDEKNVTCVFAVRVGPSNPHQLKCVGIDYFEKIDNNILLNQRYNDNIPEFVSVFKGKPFDIDIQRQRLIVL